MTEPDLVEDGGPRSRRTTSVATLVVVLFVGILAGRASSDWGNEQTGPAAARPEAQPSHPSAVTSPAAQSPSPAPAVSHAATEDAVELTAWLDTLPSRAKRPATHGKLSYLNFRVVHSQGFTGAEDYAAIAQLRNAGGRWVDVARGDVLLEPPSDASGRYVAFTVGKTHAPRLRSATGSTSRPATTVMLS